MGVVIRYIYIYIYILINNNNNYYYLLEESFVSSFLMLFILYTGVVSSNGLQNMIEYFQLLSQIKYSNTDTFHIFINES